MTKRLWHRFHCEDCGIEKYSLKKNSLTGLRCHSCQGTLRSGTAAEALLKLSQTTTDHPDPWTSCKPPWTPGADPARSSRKRARHYK